MPVDKYIEEDFDWTDNDSRVSEEMVIPFWISASSGLGQSGGILAIEVNSGIWLEGYRFNSRQSDSDIKVFIDSLTKNKEIVINACECLSRK